MTYILVYKLLQKIKSSSLIYKLFQKVVHIYTNMNNSITIDNILSNIRQNVNRYFLILKIFCNSSAMRLSSIKKVYR